MATVDWLLCRCSVPAIGLVLCLVLNAPSLTHGAKILINPSGTVCNSRLRNMQKLGHILVAAGHEAHFIFPENCGYMQQPDPEGKLVYAKYALNEQARALPVEQFFDKLLNSTITDMIHLVLSANLLYFESMLQHPGFMKRLVQENYDLGLFDISDVGSVFLTEYLNIPIIMYSNFGFIENLQLAIPMPLAYYPMATTALTDRMNFLQRLRNLVEYVATVGFVKFQVYPDLHKRTAELGYNFTETFYTIGPKVAACIINSNVALEFPRPLMPNVVMVGGIYSQPPKPLPPDLAQVVERAQHGVVIVAFGTNEFTMHEDRANRFARVFAGLKQQVIWKYKGTRPSDLGDNTLLAPWLPQNDLLGHPNTKLFVTHCGSSSVQETVYHGVPVVAVPMFGDQHHNANKMVARSGIGQQIDYWHFTESQLREAVAEVLHNATYKSNARKLSALYRDQPMPPKDRFLYWIDYVHEHGFAEHLQPRAAWDLSWIQYFLLDVIAFVIAVCVAVLVVLFVLARCLCKCCCYVCRRKHKVE